MARHKQSEQLPVGYAGQTHEIWATDGVHGIWRMGWCNGTEQERVLASQVAARKGWRVTGINRVTRKEST